MTGTKEVLASKRDQKGDSDSELVDAMTPLRPALRGFQGSRKMEC